jgi:tetratricopeptide (TPR) repeat protein
VTAFFLFALLLQPDPALTALQQGRLTDAERLLRDSLKSSPSDARALGLLGVVLDQQKKYAEAEPLHLKAIRLSPRSVPLLNNLGNHYLESGKPADAKRTFARALAIDPKHPNALLQSARASLLLNLPADADAALAKLPESPETLVLHAQSMAQRGKLPDALAAARGDVRILYNAGLGLAQAKQYAHAEAFFAAALEQAPGEPDILFNLGLAASKANHPDRAIEVFRAALRVKPDDPDVLYNLAAVYGAQNRMQDAIFALGDARRAAPHRLDILDALANALETAGYFSDAAAVWDEYYELSPAADAARRQRGFCWARAGNKDESIPDLSWYTARHPEDPVGHFQYGIALSSTDQVKSAAELTAAIQRKSDYIPALHARGALYQQQGDPVRALPDLEKVVKLEPENARALYHLGLVYRELERYPDAERVLRKAVQLTPDDGPSLMNLGYTLRDQGRTEEAQQFLARFQKLGETQKEQKPAGGLLDFISLSPEQQQQRYVANIRKGIEKSPQNPEYHIRLGSALLQAGQREEALTSFRHALTLNPPAELVLPAGKELIRFQEYALGQSYLKRVEADPASRLDLAIAEFHLSGAAAGLLSLDKIPAARRDGDYWLARAQMLDAAGKPVDAAEALNHGFRAAPTRPDLYTEAALFLVQHDQTSQANQLLAQAVIRIPDNSGLALLHSIVAELDGKTEEAIKMLSSLERRYPEWYRPWLIHGILLAAHAKPAEGRKLIESAIALGANDSEAFFYLAETINNSASNEIDAARTALERAIQLEPDDPYAHALLGKFELDAGKIDQAITHLRRATQLMPELAQAHNRLAQALTRAGRTAEAAAEAEITRKLAADQRGREPVPPMRSTLFRLRPR